MSVLALRGQLPTEPQRRLGNQPKTSMGGVCPAVAEVAAIHGITRPRTLAHLERIYWQAIENGQTDWDFGGYVLTYLRKRGEVQRSVGVDISVGERVARRLA